MSKHTNDSESAERYNLRSEIYEWFEAIVFAIVTVVIIFTFVFRVVGVQGESMKDTLNEQYVHVTNEVEDRLIISNLFYKPKRGDIIVCALPEEKPIIKRVIAVEGDVLKINPQTGEVYINDKKLDEPYVRDEPYIPSGSYECGPVKIKEGHVFVMGDNRNNSKDSRYNVVGQIDEKYILGKALIRIYPFDHFGSLYD